LFDTVLFVAFAIAYAEDFTGLSLHEWFGIAFGVALLFHFSLHWEWVVRTSKGMLRTSGRRRVMWLVNLALLGDLMLCIGSGILITGWRVFGAVFNSNAFWNNLHGTTAGVAIALIGIHIGLDWRWITNAFRRMTRRSPRHVGGTIDED
jgi:cytochrome b561